MTLVATVCLALLGLAAVLLLVYLVRGPSVPDRVVALDALLVVIMMGMGVQVATGESESFVRVLVVVALLAFVGTVAAAKFVERRGP